jgi:hypothetical protein
MIDQVASTLKVDVDTVKQMNLYKDGQVLTKCAMNGWATYLNFTSPPLPSPPPSLEGIKR